MNLAELNKVAEAMVAPGRGILAADESSRHHQEALRRHRRGMHRGHPARLSRMLFRSTDAMQNYISGVILYDETIRQNAKDGTPLVKLIEKAGALPGIKVDKGLKPLPFCPARWSPKGSTDCANGSSNIASSARASPSGAR